MTRGGATRQRTQWLSADPRKRAVERYWLLYTPVWGITGGTVMVSGLAESWGDLPLMLLGVGLALGAVVPPVAFPAAEDRRRPLHERTAFKLAASVVGFAFLMNYFCTPYFFDVLHMHYGFGTQLNIRNNPIFLYFMTVAYFATYSVLLNAGHRTSRRALASAPRLAVLAATALVPFAVAALETALNANPFMKSLFCYDDMGFMMWFGTLSYGVCFLFAMPVWLSIDERPGARTPLGQVVLWVSAAMLGIVISFEILRHGIAPHLTTVASGATGLRDFATSCLEPIVR